MRSAQRIHLVYFLSLFTALVFAGCVPQPKPVMDDVAPALTIGQTAEEYSDSVYASGDEAYPAGYYIHTVSVPNENISIIAKWYTGSQKNWVILAKCNPAIKPNRIFLGDKIKIPRSLMTRHTALPAKFVHQSHSGVKRKKTSKPSVPLVQTKTKATQPPAEEKPTKPAGEEPPFFGPKGY